MKRAIQFAGVVWLCAVPVICADQNKPKNPTLKAPPRATAKIVPPKVPKVEGGARGGVPKGAAKLPNPENPIEVLRRLTPEERERVLEKYPPKQQANIRKRLENFDNLPEAQKQRQLGWTDEFYRLPPDKQQLVRQQIRAFNALPPERLAAVRAAYARLSKASPEERAEILARPQFQARFSPEELQMLRVLPEYWPLPAR
jgi:hypothetical protein